MLINLNLATEVGIGNNLRLIILGLFNHFRLFDDLRLCLRLYHEFLGCLRNLLGLYGYFEYLISSLFGSLLELLGRHLSIIGDLFLGHIGSRELKYGNTLVNALLSGSDA